MGADPGRPGSPAAAVRTLGPAPVAAANYTPPPPAPMPASPAPALTDRTSGGYGGANVDAFKATPAYQNAVAAVFHAQGAHQQAAIIQGLAHAGDPFTIKAVQGAVATLPFDQLSALHDVLPQVGGGVDIAKLLGNAYKLVAKPENFRANATGQFDQGGQQILDAAAGGVGKLIQSIPTRAPSGPGEQIAAQAGLGPGQLGKVLLHAPLDVARAAIQQPSVIPKTIKGLGETAVGSAAALAQLPIQEVGAIAAGHPLQPLEHLVSGMAQDYSQRYGPLLTGNDNAFIARIKQQGAGAELLDALGLAGGIDLTAGRAAVNLAKVSDTMRGADAGSFLTRARPGLRISGGEVRPQQLAQGAMKITAQRIEDRLRAWRGGRQVPLAAHEVAPLAQARAMRVHVSAIASRTRSMMQNALNAEVRNGAVAAGRRLNVWERRAAPFAVEGTIPLTRGTRVAQEWIDRRMGQIRQYRAENPSSVGNRIPAQIASKTDELQLLGALRQNVDKWLTPKLAAYVKGEAERSRRLETGVHSSYLNDTTAQARRLRPQGEVLGVEHPHDAVDREIAALKQKEAKVAAVIRRPGTVGELQAARTAAQRVQRQIQDLRSGEGLPGRMAAYSDQVRALAREHGLPEPAYLQHRAHPKTDYTAYTSGQGQRAMSGVKQSKWRLFPAGAAERTMQAYVDSQARAIRGAHQWRLVDEQFRRNALPTPTHEQIRAALGRNVHPSDMTGYDLSHVLMHGGTDLKHVRFYNPGRLSEATLEDFGLLRGSRAGNQPHELDTSADLHHALNQHDAARTVDPQALRNMRDDDPFLTTKGWKAVPRSAFDEIHSGLRPSGPMGRIVGKTQGLAAGAILGLSPSFVIANTLAHVYLATFGTRGRILTDVAKFPIWWHSITPEMRARVDSMAGGRGQFRLERMGSTAQGRLATVVRGLADTRVAHAVGHLNPMRALFHAEDVQSNFFRRMVYYSAAKRLAVRNIGHDLPLAQAAAMRLHHSLTLGPKDEMARVLRSQADAEELGRYTVNMMGDYVRFTSGERQWLNNRAVLFYSFLRHATRTLLYVLPFKHPIATALVGEMAKMHNDEVKKMLGGQNLPWAYSRVFFGANGNLHSIDFMRMSPVGSAAVDTASQGLQGAAKMIAPELQPILDMMYGKTVSGGKAPANLFTALNDYLSLSYPYRLARDLRFGTRTQEPGSIPFLHERSANPKSASAQQYQAAKEAAAGPMGEKLLAGFLGIYPKPDNSLVIAQRRAAMAAKKGRGGGGGSSLSESLGGGSSSGSDLSRSLGGGGSGGGDLTRSLGGG